ncbi:hypothetical protein OU426_16520 [Frigidibacter sp. RF13]|uniref:hypothetical protein n=1 Tax=Frigidibacter sp. RF13 TaxID=2997340 RepID=UPI00226EE618|nr:hypothetical protein [Frigidibacter sp. RF13]MCY1128471.1 hypothetical protein [Frigidibacter sp. RF13]
MADVVRSSAKQSIIDRRLWRIDCGNRELVAERYRTVSGRFRTVWLVPEENLRGVLWVEVVEGPPNDPSP